MNLLLPFMTVLVAKATNGQTPSLCDKCQCNKDVVPYLVDCSQKQLDHMIQLKSLGKVEQGALADLDYSMNQIQEVIPFPSMPIHSLSLRHNKIGTIAPRAFQNLTHLNYLDLSYNLINVDDINKETFEGQYNPSDYEPLPLIELNLAYNKLSEIERTTFVHLKHLEILILDGNPLSRISDQTKTALISLTSLQSLSLADTSLKNLPDDLILQLPTLRKLNLADNLFKTVPPELVNAHELEELNLSNNRFKTLPANAFHGLTSLTRLDLNNQFHLTRIEEKAFGDLVSLETLELSNNEMLKFIHPDAFEGLYPETFKLRNLLIANNSLRYIPKQLVPDFPNWNDIQRLDLQANPWACDCHNEWILTYLIQQIMDRSPELSGNLRCGGPRPLAGLDMRHVGESGNRLPCDPQDNFDPYKESFGIANYDGRRWSKSGSQRSMSSGQVSAGVIITCLIVVIGATCFIGGLYRHRERQRAYYRSLHNSRFQQADGNVLDGAAFPATSSGLGVQPYSDSVVSASGNIYRGEN